MRLLLGYSLCLSIFLATVKCETFSECNGIENGKFVSSPKGCQYYIYCGGDASFEDFCPSDLMFNVTDGICDDPANVNCSDQSGPPSPGTITTTVNPSSTSTTPVNLPSTLTSTTINNPSSISTTLGSSTTTLTSTSSSPSTLVSTTTTSTTWSPISSPNGEIVCPQPSRPEEVIYLPNPDSCTDYYMCYHLIPIPMTCPNDLQFNSLKGSCDWAEVVNCKIVGTTTISPREICTGQYSGFLEYPNNCRYYYRCTSGMLTIQECPGGFGWDVSRKMCTTTGCKTL